MLLTGTALTASAQAAIRHAEIDGPGTTMELSFAAPVGRRKADAFATWLQDVADNVGGLYGRFPLRNVRVMIVPGNQRRRGDAPVLFGKVSRRGTETVVLYVDTTRPIEDFYADWTATHEFSHLLLPRISWQQRWISEGFASYYQNVVMARAGWYSRRQAIKKLREGLGRGRKSRPDLSPNGAALAGVRRARYKIYWSGAAIALLADVRLRERSGGAESLDVVLDRFQACCLDSRRRWSGVELFTKFDSLVDAPVFMPLYRQYADSPGFPDIGDALSKRVVRDEIFGVRTSPH